MLLVMRHAKSDWSTHSQDHARPLNRRGVASAKRMGELLSEVELVPDLVITSTANRALSTAELAARAGGWECEIVRRDDFYETSTRAVIRVLRNLDDQRVQRCLVVGHNPTWTALVGELSGSNVDMKTATIAAIESPGSWAWLGELQGRLEALFQPRHFLQP